jgi:uncharacterized protein YjbI with pentapeptide repeats
VEQDNTPRKRGAIRFIKVLVAPAWQLSRDRVLWATRIVLVLAVLLAILTLIGLPFRITLWAWVKLLIVPIVLAVGGYLLTERQRTLDREIATKQTDTDRYIATERRQDDTLQAYLDQIGQLLLYKDKPLRQSEEGDEVRTLARVRTLTVLPRLDGERKGTVLEFLHRSDLITKDRVIVDLHGADLRGINRAVSLQGVSLQGANLSNCRLTGSSIRYSDLRNANLVNTDLSAANLFGTDFRAANLTATIFSRAELYDADFRGPSGGRVAMTREATEYYARQAAESWLQTLAQVRFDGAWFSGTTKWPQGFDPRGAGARYNEGV